MIELINVSKRYKEKQEKTVVNALHNVNLKIEDGECVAITGKSGAGKSTLLNILGTIDKPTSGVVQISGNDITKMSAKEKAIYRNKNIGYVFQDFLLENSLTIKENVELPLLISKVDKAERKRRALEILDKVGLKDRVNHRPTELSGGEKQRASIARALVNNPDILLADEPTGNLDEATGNDIYELMRALTVNKVMIMVTHDKELAEKSNHIIVLKDGKIISERK